MKKSATVQDLLHDPTLSFSDFCYITNALKEGFIEEDILGMPELAHLRLDADEGSDEDTLHDTSNPPGIP